MSRFERLVAPGEQPAMSDHGLIEQIIFRDGLPTIANHVRSRDAARLHVLTLQGQISKLCDIGHTTSFS